MQREPGAEHTIGANAPEDEIGVGNRGVFSSRAVSGGTGARTRTVRPDPESAAIFPANRTASRADGVDIDHRGHDGEAAHLTLGTNDRLSPHHEAGLEARAPHVDAD